MKGHFHRAEIVTELTVPGTVLGMEYAKMAKRPSYPVRTPWSVTEIMVLRAVYTQRTH